MIKVIQTNQFASSTVTAKTEAAGYDKENVLETRPKKTYRSTSNANQYLKFDLGSAKSIDFISLFNVNFTSNADVKIYAHASDLGNTAGDWQSSASFKTGNAFTVGSYAAHLSIASPQSYRYWFLEIDDQTNGSAYIELGTLFGGLSDSTDENFNEDFTEEYDDTSLTEQSDGYHKFSVEKEIGQIFSITFSDIDKDNRDKVTNWFKNARKTRPFVASLDPENDLLRLTILCTFDSNPVFEYTPNERSTVGFVLREQR